MTDFHFDTSDIDALVGRLAGADKVIQKHIVRGVDDSGKYVEGTAKEVAPVRTGHYRRNITSRAQALASGAMAIVRASAPYSKWVEEGHGFYVVRARSRKALRFTVGGRVVFAKSVIVGPMRGQYIMRQSLLRNRSRIQARLRRAGREAADEILGGAA